MIRLNKFTKKKVAALMYIKFTYALKMYYLCVYSQHKYFIFRKEKSKRNHHFYLINHILNGDIDNGWTHTHTHARRTTVLKEKY